MLAGIEANAAAGTAARWRVTLAVFPRSTHCAAEDVLRALQFPGRLANRSCSPASLSSSGPSSPNQSSSHTSSSLRRASPANVHARILRLQTDVQEDGDRSAGCYRDKRQRCLAGRVTVSVPLEPERASAHSTMVIVADLPGSARYGATGSSLSASIPGHHLASVPLGIQVFQAQHVTQFVGDGGQHRSIPRWSADGPSAFRFQP